MGCNNNCDAVAGLHEAAANLIQYRDKINAWLNGGVDQTVDIAGIPTPTLLNLAMNIKQLVGVWPDNLTIKIDPNTKKIYAPLKPNGGVHVDANGIYIDANDFLQLGGGLAKDPATGEIYVDFSQMPTDKFEKLLQSLRLPIYLDQNTVFYVNINDPNATDDLEQNPGLSLLKPFKHIQNAVNFVNQNYNLGPYNAYIRIVPGEYHENLNLNDYVTTGGRILLERHIGATGNVRIYCGNRDSGQGVICSGGTYHLNNLFIDYVPTFIKSDVSGLLYAIHAIGSGSNLFMRSTRVHFMNAAGVTGNPSFLYYSLIRSSNNAHITFMPRLSGDSDSLVFIFDPDKTRGTRDGYVLEQEDGHISFNGSDISQVDAMIYAYGDFTTFLQNSGGNTIRYGATTYKMGIETGGYTATGRRYSIFNGGTCNTLGGGPNFFPGDTAGFVQEASYSWYL